MAAMLDLPPPNATVVRESRTEDDDRLTQCAAPRFEPDPEPEFYRHAFSVRGRTATAVLQGERGDRYSSEVDVGEFRRVKTPVIVAEDSTDGSAVRERSELAREVRNRIRELIPLVGDISFATSVQLLKRDLSRCHDALVRHQSESNFLSIVTVVESAISQRKWRDYTPQQLELLQCAVEIGYRQPTVTYSDYINVCRQLSQAAVDVHPRIKLDDLKLSDLTDDESEEE